MTMRFRICHHPERHGTARHRSEKRTPKPFILPVMVSHVDERESSVCFTRAAHRMDR